MSQQQNVVFKKNNEAFIDQIEAYYASYQCANPSDTIKAFFKTNNKTTITVWKNRTVLFAGPVAKQEVEKFMLSLGHVTNTAKKNEKNNFWDTTIIGSDEVGVSDYFGPLVVTACQLKKDQLSALQKLKITDSKKYNDQTIMNLAKKIIPLVNWNYKIFYNSAYNTLYDVFKNSHIIKTIGHYECIYALREKLKSKAFAIIDGYVNKKKTFIKYLNVSKCYLDNFQLVPKAETEYAAVAVSSILARFLFLKTIHALEAEFKLKIVLGAGEPAKKQVKYYLKQRSHYEYKHYLKVHMLSSLQ